MKTLTLGSLLLSAVVLLAGCAGLQSSNGASGSLAQSGDAPALMPHSLQRHVRSDYGRSWMLPQKKGHKETLIYAGDEETNDVNVYDYSNGKLVGALTGLDGPDGGCVDAKGDVYITNYDAGNAVEYAHGGTKVINTYDSGGTPLGCAVDSKGDVAVTSFDPGEAVVFSGGDPQKGTTYTAACTYVWAMGYDRSGNLIGVGENSSGGRCYSGLLAGATNMSSLSFSGTIDFPGLTMWDGKYIALGDQEAGGTYNTGIYPSMLKGSTLLPVGSEVVFTDTCYNNYSDIGQPFIVGKKNTPVNDQRGTVVVGTNLWCVDGGSGGGIKFWHYPQGGNPFKAYSQDSGSVLAVSIGT